jgi:septal ring factor EnvC (AmiA/AmiB activator)
VVYVAFALLVTVYVATLILWRNDARVLAYEVQQLRWKLTCHKDAADHSASQLAATEEVVQSHQIEIGALEEKLVESSLEIARLRKALDAMIANTKANGRKHVPWEKLIREVMRNG